MDEIRIKFLESSIRDAYYRIGTYIGDQENSTSGDAYVQLQIKRIKAWQEQLNKLLAKARE